MFHKSWFIIQWNDMQPEKKKRVDVHVLSILYCLSYATLGINVLAYIETENSSRKNSLKVEMRLTEKNRFTFYYYILLYLLYFIPQPFYYLFYKSVVLNTWRFCLLERISNKTLPNLMGRDLNRRMWMDIYSCLQKSKTP